MDDGVTTCDDITAATEWMTVSPCTCDDITAASEWMTVGVRGTTYDDIAVERLLQETVQRHLQ